MNWYREADAELTVLAAAVQSQHTIQLRKLEELAVELVVSLKQSDELVVEALSNPSGAPLIANLANVAVLATKVGLGLGYYGREVERLALAGLVHDIGIFAVPQALVMKPGRLTPDERVTIERHPELGCAAILRAGSEYQWLGQLVRQAHERSNGQGYPGRLKGRQIGEMAQIIGVADVFDALVSERPYRRRLLPSEAIKELLVAERDAFPREIVKALVEQLSVYPLGTTVRLSTGEVGTVMRVNARYPLRPVVRVSERESIEAVRGRQVDISLTPLVSIVEILDPPVVGRVVFAEGAAKAETAQAPGIASEHMTSILESLDAIAGAIRGAVEARLSSAPEQALPGCTHTSERLPGNRKQDHVDPGFQKEVIGLFALEAREWLLQIQAALGKLGAGVEGPVRSTLYGIMLNGITNLAKSASTVHLSEIEEMASNLLPLLRHLGEGDTGIQPEAVRPLQTGIENISATVQRLMQKATGPDTETVEAEGTQPILSVECAGSAMEPCPSPPRVQVPEQVQSSMSLLNALHELHRVRARSVQPARDVLEAVIQRAEEEAAESPCQVDRTVIGRILRDLDRMDEEFLCEVHSCVPAMTDMLSNLRAQGAPDFVTASQLDPILGRLDSLHDLARTVQATSIMMLLQGIKSFLAATAYRKIANLPQRLEVIDTRLKTLAPMAEQWVNWGHLERAAIKNILPA